MLEIDVLLNEKLNIYKILFNLQPMHMHNWEVLLHFAVHGQAKHLFGDGFAVWYTKERGQLGPVMGNRDFFTGLGIIFDTYSNHNGEHVVSLAEQLYDPHC